MTVSAAGTGVRPPVAVGLLATLAVLARAPFLTRPLTPDEGGFLLVAAQWHAGSSLYGDYWVDRPPVLLTLLLPVAGWSRPGLGLHLLGTVAVVAAVLLAGRLSVLLAPGHPRAGAVGAATAAVFLTAPLFGAASEVDGELLGVPFVLASLVATLTAAGSSARSGRAGWPLGWWALAGVTALLAVGVKQSLADGFVGAATVGAGLLLGRRCASGARRVEGPLAFVAGAGAALVAVLAWAAAHGTDPGPLWNAVVTFREHAGSVIADNAPAAYHVRAAHLALAFLMSGAAAVALAGALPRLRRPTWAGEDRRILLVAVLGWEVVAVAVGGSYWLHYLIGTVPGLVIAAAVACRARPHRPAVVGAALVWAVAVSVVLDVAGFGRPSGSDLAVEHYLAARVRPGDTGVVAFGDPALLESSGLSSPYPQLWSLPVRVRDPRLRRLATVLDSPDRPTWLVVSGHSLATWGVDPVPAAERATRRHYRQRAVIGDWRVLHVRS